MQVVCLYQLSFHGNLSSQTFSQTKTGCLDAARAKTAPCGIIESPAFFFQKEDAGCVNPELLDRLLKHDIKRDLYIETRAYRKVNGAESANAVTAAAAQLTSASEQSVMQDSAEAASCSRMERR
jgi:hypothetical protein